MKTPLVSVLVHTKNSRRTIREHLESIRNQTYKNIEIIAADNQSTDGTLQILKQFTKSVYTHGPERSAQRNYAARKARGVYFLIPDSDMILGKDVIAQCVRVISKNSKIKAVVVPEKSIGKGFWAKCKTLERSYYVGLDWMEGARFFRKSIFDEMGGYDVRNTGTEDYDLPQRIEKKYGKDSIGRISDFIAHDEGNLTLWHTMKKKFYYAKKLHIYKRSNMDYYRKQANILLRLHLFFSKPKKILADPLVGSGMIFMKTCEFLAGSIGFLTVKFSHE